MGESMKKWIENISRKVGFTHTETKILLILLVVFLFGIIINYIKNSANSPGMFEFDYSVSDSLYNAALMENEGAESNIEDSIAKKTFASKTELLDFVEGKMKHRLETEKSKLPPKIVNINLATKDELARLPGLGDKTAENIIQYREKIGRITKTDQLLNVKGIGKSKLNKISSFIKFE